MYVDIENTSGDSGGFLGNHAETSGTGNAGVGGAVYLDGASTSTSQADIDTDAGAGANFGDSGTWSDNTPDDIYVNDEGAAYFLGDGSAKDGRVLDCDSGGETNSCDIQDLTADWQNHISTSLAGATSGLFGHSIRADNDYEIYGFGMVGDFSAATSCDFNFYVLESYSGGTSLSDWWEVASAQSNSAAMSSTGYAETGYIGDLTLDSNRYYAFLMGWDCDADYVPWASSVAETTLMGTVSGTEFYGSDPADWATGMTTSTDYGMWAATIIEYN